MRAIISGFGPFEGIEHNPTQDLVETLLETPLDGWEFEGAVLPVSFERAPEVWDELLGSAGASPDLLVAFGVAGKASEFALEAWARARPQPKSTSRGDNDGVDVASAAPTAEVDLHSTLDVTALVGRLQAQSDLPPVRRSEDAGAYVCERVYHHVLVRARERGVPGLFVHVPPFEVVDRERQLDFLRALFGELGALVSDA